MIAASLSPTIVPIVIIGTLTLLLATGLVVMVGRAEGPGPADTAVAYEQAWDRFDFATLWNLSSPRLRDGRNRVQFVQDKQDAYQAEAPLTRLVRNVSPEAIEINGPVARVFTRLDLADGETLRDEMLLERISGDWLVTAYHIASRQAGA